ncbi:cobyrinic acid a,c-diamide synthase [Candidatus Aerophobetes bacterium]|uniref:Cobyrinic acid a,c-diamide synthase n=1 Tax=Aerophobetes bacterium TaxID=2030807 RepID=A0A2A4X8T2_UNCAE|nr:MAG: cobyrinic acid a,c-diamide synthase [Candidatus Aerophobetes bacterium]
MKHCSFFIAATGQHIGKTTTCLGLVSGLKKRVGSVGFFKPVGQEYVELEKDYHVDKDVLLFDEHLNLHSDLRLMSPILLPRGFTRDFLDQKITTKEIEAKIIHAFLALKKMHHNIIVEGTGHIGVGSIVGCNNAKVAKDLNLPIVIVASGGLGSAFDALAINKALCDQQGVKIAGVILNRVIEDKKEMILHYMKKALQTWDIPLLGCIPYAPFLSNPSMKDFELLFKAPILSGQNHYMRHFKQTKFVASTLENFKNIILPGQLIITASNREDIILDTLARQLEAKENSTDADLGLGMILTGKLAPREDIVDQLRKADIPMIHAPLSSYKAMELITSYTVKIGREDKEKVDLATKLAEENIDFDLLLSQISRST